MTKKKVPTVKKTITKRVKVKKTIEEEQDFIINQICANTEEERLKAWASLVPDLEKDFKELLFPGVSSTFVMPKGKVNIVEKSPSQPAVFINEEGDGVDSSDALDSYNLYPAEYLITSLGLVSIADIAAHNLFNIRRTYKDIVDKFTQQVHSKYNMLFKECLRRNKNVTKFFGFTDFLKLLIKRIPIRTQLLVTLSNDSSRFDYFVMHPESFDLLSRIVIESNVPSHIKDDLKLNTLFRKPVYVSAHFDSNMIYGVTQNIIRNDLRFDGIACMNCDQFIKGIPSYGAMYAQQLSTCIRDIDKVFGYKLSK